MQAQLLRSQSEHVEPPRVANRLLRRARDFADVEGNGTITLSIAQIALDRLELMKWVSTQWTAAF